MLKVYTVCLTIFYHTRAELGASLEDPAHPELQRGILSQTHELINCWIATHIIFNYLSLHLHILIIYACIYLFKIHNCTVFLMANMVPLHNLDQWFSTFIMLQFFHIIPSIEVTPNYKIIFAANS